MGTTRDNQLTRTDAPTRRRAERATIASRAKETDELYNTNLSFLAHVGPLAPLC
ncbi:MAG: hypothetical protein M3O92_08400 [Actinomycetota bacterium]|nr:hypothetical protein [Actinomycetota bacterium]